MVHVRGTLASGKTVLKLLLHSSILNPRADDPPVYSIHGWIEAEVRQRGGWHKYLIHEGVDIEGE